MTALFAAFAAWIVGAGLAWRLRRTEAGTTVGAWTALIGCGFVLASALPRLAAGASTRFEAAWPVPFGALTLRLDPLASAFLLPLAVVGGLCAIYGAGYLRLAPRRGPAGGSFVGYNLLLASMALVIVSSNLILFLVAWEAMTLASYALIVTDHESRAVRAAGFQYLVAAHFATGALLLLFVVLGSAGGWDMKDAPALRTALPAGWLVVLALIGFGTKAAVVPFHVWLPDAHAAAPSHVSALLSGVMITLGFYGLARFLPWLGPPSAAVGYVMIVLGAAGALTASLLALVQRDVKRVLAYSTVENAGLVTLAMGMGLLGRAFGQPLLASLGWTAALLHIWNHALFKSVLFQGIGAVAHAAHTRDLESWGGVARHWPMGGVLIVVGAFAIAGLPGLNGFVAEWLMFRALLEGMLTLQGGARVVMVLGLGTLALTAALALAVYVRLIGVGLLGEPRSEAVAKLAMPGLGLVGPMAAAVSLCVLVAWLPGRVVGALDGAVHVLLAGGGTSGVATEVAPLAGLALALAALTALLLVLRRVLGRGRVGRTSITWDCGYALPGPRTQYTGASVAELPGRLFAPLLRTRIEGDLPSGSFPGATSWRSRTVDRALSDVYRPLVEALAGAYERVRNVQEPRVTTYLRYVLLALLVVLALLFLPIVVQS